MDLAAVVLNDVTKLILAMGGVLGALGTLFASVRRKAAAEPIPLERYLEAERARVAAEGRAAHRKFDLDTCRQKLRDHLKHSHGTEAAR